MPSRGGRPTGSAKRSWSRTSGCSRRSSGQRATTARSSGFERRAGGGCRGRDKAMNKDGEAKAVARQAGRRRAGLNDDIGEEARLRLFRTQFVIRQAEQRAYDLFLQN